MQDIGGFELRTTCLKNKAGKRLKKAVIRKISLIFYVFYLL